MLQIHMENDTLGLEMILPDICIKYLIYMSSIFILSSIHAFTQNDRNDKNNSSASRI